MNLSKPTLCFFSCIVLEVFSGCSPNTKPEQDRSEVTVLLEIARARNKMQGELLNATIDVATVNKWDMLGTEQLKRSRFVDTISDIGYGAKRLVSVLDQGITDLQDSAKLSQFFKRNFKVELQHFKNHAALYYNNIEADSLFNLPKYDPLSYENILVQELVLEELKGIALVMVNQWLPRHMIIKTRLSLGKGDTLTHTVTQDINQRDPTIEEILSQRK